MPQRKPGNENIFVNVSDILDQRYEVVPKTTTPSANTYKGKPVTWVASYGFRPKKGINIAQGKLDAQGFMQGNLEQDYTIQLAKAGNVLVYDDGTGLQELAYSPANAPMGDMVQATLAAADPPVGWAS
jgi:hypothetical protein